MKCLNVLSLAATCAACLAMTAATSTAAIVNWDGSEDGSWATAGNWDSGSLPGSSDNVVFNANTVTNQISSLGGDQTVASVSFSNNISGDISVAAGNSLTVGTLTVDSGHVVTLANTLTVNKAFSKVKSGELKITGETNFTYTSTRHLSIGASSGTATLRIDGGTITDTGSTTNYAWTVGDTSTGYGGATGAYGAVIQENNAVVTLTTGNIALAFNAATDSGSYTLNSGTLNLTNSDKGFLIVGRNGAGVFTQNGGVVNLGRNLNNNPAMTLGGAGGTYNLNAGLLRVNDIIRSADKVATFNFAGGTISAYNRNMSIGASSSSTNFDITLTGDDAVISSSDAGDVARIVTIYSGITGNHGIAFAGGGTVALQNAVSYTGETKVLSGSLTTAAATAPFNAESIMNVASGAAFSDVYATGRDLTFAGLKGAGSLSANADANSFVVAAGGSLAPGDNGAGALNIAKGGLSLGDDVAYAYQIGGTTLDTLSDGINISGALTLGAGNSYSLNISAIDGSTVDPTGKTFVLFDAGTAITDIGTWNITSRPGGWNGGTVQVNSLDNTQLVLTGLAQVPEPSTIILLGMSTLMSIMVYAWRKHKK